MDQTFLQCKSDSITPLKKLLVSYPLKINSKLIKWVDPHGLIKAVQDLALTSLQAYLVPLSLRSSSSSLYDVP